MLSEVKHILSKISENRKRKKYFDGYYYAAGELLLGTPPSYFEAKMEISKNALTYDHFDSGIEAAIRDWKEKCNYPQENNNE